MPAHPVACSSPFKVITNLCRPDSSPCSSHSPSMPASPPSSVAEQAPAAGPVAAPQPTNSVLEHSLSGAKRKEMEPERKRPGFKVVGQMVLAMKRFSSELGSGLVGATELPVGGGIGSRHFAMGARVPAPIAGSAFLQPE